MRHYRYCDDIENVENYELAKADNFKGWDCHHRLELIATGGVCDVTAQDLIDWGIYYHRPADELIFLRHDEHKSLHMKGKNYFKGKHHSEETKKRLSSSNKGQHRSEETKRNISEAMKGKPSWNKGIHMTEEWKKLHSTFGASYGAKDKHWYTNGFISVLAFECPDGFKRGRHSRKVH